MTMCPGKYIECDFPLHEANRLAVNGASEFHKEGGVSPMKCSVRWLVAGQHNG